MKICQPHWDKLRGEIISKGMGHLIAKDSENAISRIEKELKQEKTVRDPLMRANFAIWNNALEQGGPYLMFADEMGNHYCPLCEVNKHLGEGSSDKWIGYAVDEQLKECRTEGLLNQN